MSTEYNSWKNELSIIHNAKDSLHYEDFTQELHEVYARKQTIIEEILQDLAPQLDDEQYCGTTSWGYEKELEMLNHKQKELEPLIEQKIATIEHEKLLQDLGMTQIQWEDHIKETSHKVKKHKK